MDLACPQEPYSTVFPSSFWFCSLDVSAERRVVVTGDNVGHVVLLNLDGREVCSPEPGASLSLPSPHPPHPCLVLRPHLNQAFLRSFGI